jgi:ankyrin repeat protein
MKAVESGDKEIFDAILKKESNVDAVTTHGNSALIKAAERNEIDFVRKLLKKGADANLVNNKGRNALSLTLERKGDEFVVRRGFQEMFETLVKNNAKLPTPKAGEEHLYNGIEKKIVDVKTGKKPSESPQPKSSKKAANAQRPPIIVG